MKHNTIVLFCPLVFIGCTGQTYNIRQQDLMGTPDTLSNFWFSTDPELPSMNENAYWLMNRMMQMQGETVTADEDWAWMQAVGDYVTEYNTRIGRVMDKRASENMAMQDIENLISHYSGGNQPELNTWTYVMSILSGSKASPPNHSTHSKLRRDL